MKKPLSQKSKDFQDRISAADPARLNCYIDMFDRFLLYSLVSNVMPEEAIQEIIQSWERTIKDTIDSECSMRTNFLESTLQGRLCKKHHQPDGEAIRLSALEGFNVAKEIVQSNLKKRNTGFGGSNSEEFGAEPNDQ